jgi:hypothetical protein
MALSEDRRALLRLLIGGDSYDEVAAVLGTSPEDVRERARAAVAELERGGSDPELSGAARRRLDELEGAPAELASAGAQASPAGARRPSRAAWITIGGAVAALLIAFVIVQVSDDSDDPSPAPPPVEEDVVEVPLEPVAGSGARGTARIVRVSDLPALDVDVSGLEPSRANQTYVLWLLGSGDEGIPLAFRDVGPDGRFVGRTRIPAAAAGLLPSIQFIDLSLAVDEEASAAVRAAAQASTLPGRFGTSVVRGSVPR